MFLEDAKLKSLFRISPVIEFPDSVKVFRLLKQNTDRMSNEDLNDLHEKVKRSLKKIPPARYKIITTGRRGYLKYPRTKSAVKNEFLEKMEKYINSNWNIRERKSFLMCEQNVDETVLLGELGSGSNKIIEPVETLEIKRELSHFFGGDGDIVFGKTLEEWEYGFKVGNRYAIVLTQYRVGKDIVRFANDVLNFIMDDFIHVIHFEPMYQVEAQKRVESALSHARSTNMPPEFIAELQELAHALELGEAELLQYAQTLFVFADSEREAVEKAYKIKSILPYPAEFEGTIEFEMPFILTDFDFLKRMNGTNVARVSSIDYLSTLIPVTTRFHGKAEKHFIPMLNQAIEPAYVPINTELFNGAILGQMGSGKSVTTQYISTMFDMSIFIEKIQSDVGSYGVYVNYFDGEYIPISLEVPVSINPLGKAYSYFTADSYKLLKQAGVFEPHKEFQDDERSAFERVMDWYVFEEKGETKELSKRELIELAEKDSKTVRIKRLFESLPEDFKWKVEFKVNSSRKIFIRTVIAFMYQGKDKDIPQLSNVISVIEKIIDDFYKEQFRKNPNRELLISDLFEFIEKQEQNEITKRLLSRLYSFKQGGQYGHLFDAPTNLKESENVFFEVRFEEEEVVPIVIMTIMDYVNRVYGSFRHKDKTKLMALDEGWFFMKIPMAKSFVDEAFRTYRKRGIQITFGTQRPKDVEEMKNYLPYLFILYQESPDEAVEVFGFNERDRSLLKTIEKPKAYGYRYSKMFIKFQNELGNNEKGLFILPSYPEFRWIAETDPVFKLERDEAVRKAGSLRKGIELLSFGGNQ